MRAHFRHLRFKSFSMGSKAQQSIEIWPFNSHSEISGVHRDSLSQNGSCLGSVSAHSLTLPMPLPLLPGFLPFDSRASFLLTPTTLQPLALVASPKLGLRHSMTNDEDKFFLTNFLKIHESVSHLKQTLCCMHDWNDSSNQNSKPLRDAKNLKKYYGYSQNGMEDWRRSV
jgi:hypothetical protein